MWEYDLNGTYGSLSFRIMSVLFGSQNRSILTLGTGGPKRG